MDQAVHSLTSAIASGNTEAFTRFYRAWFDRAVAHARDATGLGEDFCLDVVQDAMMRIIKSIKPLKSEGALNQYLRLTVHSCAMDRLRREARRRKREIVAAELSSSDMSGEFDDRIAWLRNEMAKLDDESRRLLTLRHRFDLTLAQIGVIVGLKTGAVDGRIRRVLQMLRRRDSEVIDE